MGKDKYEISLWADEPHYNTDNEFDYYDEVKLAVIGSDSMTTDCRAIEPKLVENVNGTHTFTFKMYYSYRNDDGTIYENPFLNLLTNERKVKVLWKDDWYDFVIKSCQEDSSGKSITYTCKDLYVNELSKNGFGLNFDNELMNNMGTAEELGAKVVDGTDWVVIGKDGYALMVVDGEVVSLSGPAPDYVIEEPTLKSSVVYQTSEEAVYECIASTSFDAFNQTTSTTVAIPSGATILVYYNQIQALPTTQTTLDLQFAYNTNYETEFNSQLVKEADCYLLEGVSATPSSSSIVFSKNSTNIFTIVNKNSVSSQYRAKRLVTTEVQIADYLTKKVCTPFTAQSAASASASTRLDLAPFGSLTTASTINSETQFPFDADNYKYLTEDSSYDFHLQSISSPTLINATLTSTETRDGYIWGKFGNLPSISSYIWTTGDYISFGGNKVYYNEGDRIYRYQQSVFENPTTVVNLVSNPENFNSTDGWDKGNTGTFMPDLYPPIYSAPTQGGYLDWNPVSYLHITSSASCSFYNNGLISSLGQLSDGLVKGQEFIVDIVAYNSAHESIIGNPFTIAIVDNLGESYADWVQEKNELKVTKSISNNDIKFRNLKFQFSAGQIDINLKSVYIYKKVVIGVDDDDHEIILKPNELTNSENLIKTYYYYYNHTKYKDETDPSKIEYLYCGEEKWTEGEANLTPDTGLKVDFEKVSSITAKQSNRFNIIQTIAETFECWPKFTIKHDQATGKIERYDATDSSIPSQFWNKPKKFISFKEEIGEETGVGFVYGIDLKTIQRTIDSEQIVTKTIVQDNINEFANQGFCTIRRSDQNMSGANYILNFDYYITRGLLDPEQLNADLYDTTSPNIGLLSYLREQNRQLMFLSQVIIDKKSLRDQYLKVKTTSDLLVDKSTSAVQDAENHLLRLAGVEPTLNHEQDMNDAYAILNAFASDDSHDIKTGLESLGTAQRTLEKARIDQSSSTIAYNQINESIETLQGNYTTIANEVAEKENEFYSRYANFLQEGTWQDSNYINDDAYYLDAQKVAYTSSRPKVSYNISVLRLSSLDEFKAKVFRCGDIAFIQDTEFFGYKTINDVKTPYKEKVLVSEITSYFDEPDKDTITVQNYKTQFEDLFQRITSTTQSLQFAQGSYERAATKVKADGSFEYEAIQDTLANNAQLVFGAQNQTVVTDQTGIIVSDTTNLANKSKLTSGGLFITKDGGVTWENGITSNGVAVSALTAGIITTDKIQIMDGNNLGFRWDSQGIDAYSWTIPDDSGGKKVYDFKKFVRHDGFGIYGIALPSSGTSFIPTNEDKIWNSEYAKFGLTWKGFFMKEKDDLGSIEISNENQILVKKKTNNHYNDVIRIGRVGAIDGTQVQINKLGQKTSVYYAITSNNIIDESDLVWQGELGKYKLQKTFNITNLGDEPTTFSISYQASFTWESGNAWSGQSFATTGTLDPGQSKDVYIENYVEYDGSNYTIEVSKGQESQKKNIKDFFFRVDGGSGEDTYYYFGIVSRSSQGQLRDKDMLSKLGNNQSIVETDSWSSNQDQYGIKIYNNNGDQTFFVDENGDATLTGTIYAGSGLIGGWNIAPYKLSSSYTDSSLGLHSEIYIDSYPGLNSQHPCWIKAQSEVGSFEVSKNGNVTMSGTLTAGSVIETGADDKTTMLGGWQLFGNYFGKQVNHKIIGFDIGQVGTTNQVFGIGGNGINTTLTSSWSDCQFRINGQGTVLIGADSDYNQLELKAGSEESSSLIRFLDSGSVILRIDTSGINYAISGKYISWVDFFDKLESIS